MNKAAKIISVCAASATALGLCVFAVYLTRDNKAPTFSNTVGIEEVQKTTSPIPDDWSEKYGYVASKTGLTGRAEMYLEKNKDYVGWIKVNNTKVNEPIVMDPGDVGADSEYAGDYFANSYYLDHDLDGESARAGAVFMDYRNNFGGSEADQSDNILLYGHNMANNTMFGSLRRYRQDYSFYDEAPFIELSSNYKDYQYIIFGYMITSGNADTDFRYWDMEEFADEKEFNSFVETVRAGSMVDTGVDMKYGDKLLTLSTCYADEDNSRFIICARRLRDDEKPGDVSSIARTEEYKKKKQEEEASKNAEKNKEKEEKSTKKSDG